MNYKDKNIWIIGASFGIGEQLYLQLKNLGANLAISARSEEKLQKIISTSSSDLSIYMDIADENSVNQAVNLIKEKWQKIDLIIFCAGVYQPMNIDNFNLEKAKSIIDINFTGFINLLDKILPLIKQRKIAHLAIISSVASYFGMNNSLCYGASKAALSNFVESLYLELKKYDTKINLINPGFVQSRLTDKNKFKMPFIITAKRAAGIIIRKLPNHKFEIYFPKIFVLIMKFIALMPYKVKLSILSKIK